MSTPRQTDDTWPIFRKKNAIVLVGGAVVLVAFVAAIYWGPNVGLITGGRLAAPTETQFVDVAVGPVIGDIVVFKSPDGRIGAIRFDHLTNDFGADYTTWFLSDTGTTFEGVQPSGGHVFEKYWRTWTGLGEQQVEDIGGQYQVGCGPFTFEWSASTWVYFPEGWSVGVAPQGEISDVDLADPSIEWRKTGN